MLPKNLLLIKRPHFPFSPKMVNRKENSGRLNRKGREEIQEINSPFLLTFFHGFAMMRTYEIEQDVVKTAKGMETYHGNENTYLR